MSREHKPADLLHFVREASRVFDVPPLYLYGPVRSQAVSAARHVAVYCLRKRGWTLEAIGEAFGGRDHTTIRNSIRRVENDEALLARAKTMLSAATDLDAPPGTQRRSDVERIVGIWESGLAVPMSRYDTEALVDMLCADEA